MADRDSHPVEPAPSRDSASIGSDPVRSGSPDAAGFADPTASGHSSDGHDCMCGNASRGASLDEPARGGFSRRGFLQSLGLGVAAAVTTGAAAAGPAEAASASATAAAAGDAVPVTLQINGREHRLLVEPRWSLLHVLREKLGLTGTKVGCERGECGACTVLIDDLPRYACMTLALEAEGHEITTLEGLMDGEELGPTQQAFLEEDAYQCGYCTPGQIVAVEGLLRANPDPDLEAVRRGVSGNLCRCGAYVHIFRAARRAAELKQGGGR